MTKARAQTIRFKDLTFAPRFEHGEMAQVSIVSGTEMGTRLGTGFARFTQAHIPWTVQYDEVILVLSGNLTVHTPQDSMTVGPQDSIWLPNGTEVIYESEEALVFYAIEPSNWAEGSA